MTLEWVARPTILDFSHSLIEFHAASEFRARFAAWLGSHQRRGPGISRAFSASALATLDFSPVDAFISDLAMASSDLSALPGTMTLVC